MKKKLLPGITSLGIEISGRDEVLVCGCLGIGFYSPDEVKLNVPTGGLSITGGKTRTSLGGLRQAFGCGNYNVGDFLLIWEDFMNIFAARTPLRRKRNRFAAH